MSLAVTWMDLEIITLSEVSLYFTVPYIKQTNNKDLLYSSGNYTQYPEITYNGKESKNICV